MFKMNYLGKFISNFKDFYNEINSATLTGAIDVVVIQQPDGTYLCSPFHVRFGKIGVLRSREKIVDIEINGSPVDIHMKLGDSGEAFFVEEVENEDIEVPLHLATSPLPVTPDIEIEFKKMKLAVENETADASGNLGGPLACAQPTVTSTKANSSEVEQLTSTLITQTNKAEVVGMSPILEVASEAVTSLADEYKTRRKKRRKISTKKKSKSHEIDIPMFLSPETRDRIVLESNLRCDNSADQNETDKSEEIFQMDDDYAENEYDEGYLPGGLSRSVSLPVTSDKLAGPEWSPRKTSSTFTGEFHPFSDGDVTPQSSPTGSRPPSPKSDTEYENQKHDVMSQTDANGPSWGWGELPNMPRRASDTQLSDRDGAILSTVTEDAATTETRTEDEKRSMLSGMLNFMRSTKKLRHMPESEGIYLDDINTNDLDPEVAALYFPKFRSSYFPQGEIRSNINDEDAESGNGPSLPHSPHSVEGAIGGPHSQDSDCDDRPYGYECYHNVSMSLCGGLQDTESELPSDRFFNSIVTFNEFTENPALLQNPNLVVRIDGKYYNWATAAPMLVSMVMFQQPLPENTMSQLISEHMPKKKKAKGYTSWWSWRRTETESKTETAVPPTVDTANAETNTETLPPLEVPNENSSTKTEYTETVQVVESIRIENQGSEVIVESAKHYEISEKSSTGETTRTEILLTAASSNSTSEASSPTPVDDESSRLNINNVVPPDIQETVNTDIRKRPHKEKYKKSLRLTSEQIAKLNLKNGPNEVVFSVTTAYQGTSRCKCHIYLWNYDDKIVISDIDGTITKSDVLGHLMPIIGRDWAQFGVAQLFTKVKENGYQFLYLSARAIGQARTTRDYLRSIRQGEVCLPDGPLFLSPTSLISALHREVIERKPEEFKISCLKDIRTLFPPFMGNPFYAGFGNKINDTWAYRAVGIPITRIFTINHRGELKLELIQTFQSSYTRLIDQVDHMFPPLNRCKKVNGQLAPNFTATEEFSYFTYWREPLAAVSNEDLPD